MALDSHEEEQVEAIKKWWAENGSAVLLGTVLGLALLFSWRSWNSYTLGKAEMASNSYEMVLNLLQNNQADKALEEAQKLLSEQPDSHYAAMATLLLAEQDVKTGKTDSAMARLDWVLQRSHLAIELQQVARLRKARLLAVKDDASGALSLLQGAEPGAFKAAYEELKGDILLAQKKPAEAKQAYDAALTETTLAGQARKLIEMKRDDIGIAADAVAVAGAVTAKDLETPLPVAATPAPGAAPLPDFSSQIITPPEGVKPGIQPAAKPAESAPALPAPPSPALTEPAAPAAAKPAESAAPAATPAAPTQAAPASQP